MTSVVFLKLLGILSALFSLFALRPAGLDLFDAASIFRETHHQVGVEISGIPGGDAGESIGR
jgi:hypothetical protein